MNPLSNDGRETPDDLCDARGTAGIRLALLDCFELNMGGVVAVLPRTTQRVVALLALRDRPLMRAYVAGTLWPDVAEDQAAASLRTALWKARLKTRHEVLVATRTHLSLAPAVSVDTRLMAVRAQELIAARAEMSADCQMLISGGELLPGWYDDWIVVDRERLRQLRLHALEIMCERFSQEHRHLEAVQAGLAAVAGEPFRESAHRAVMKAHVAAGNRSEALRQYARYRQLAVDAFGVGPSPEMEALLQTPLVHPAQVLASGTAAQGESA